MVVGNVTPKGTCCEAKYCDCCKCKNFRGVRKLVEIKKGLTIYHAPREDDDNVPATTYNMSDSGKTIQADDKMVIIVHNTKDDDIASADFLSELDINTVNCPRCRYIMARAKVLLEGLPIVKKEMIRCVCDLCRLQQQSRVPCRFCQSVVKQFLSIGIKEDRIEEYFLTFLANAARFLSIDTKLKKYEKFRAYSDELIERPKSIQIDKDKEKLETFLNQQKKVTIQTPKKVLSVEKLFIHEDKRIEDEFGIIKTHPIIKPFPDKGPRKLMTHFTNRDEQLSHHPKGFSDTVLGIGTTGMKRRSYSELSLSFPLKKGTLAEPMHFFFPRKIKEKEKELAKTSFDLINNVEKSLTTEGHDKSKKWDDVKKRKIEKEQKRVFAEDEIKQKLIKADEKIKIAKDFGKKMEEGKGTIGKDRVKTKEKTERVEIKKERVDTKKERVERKKEKGTVEKRKEKEKVETKKGKDGVETKKGKERVEREKDKERGERNHEKERLETKKGKEKGERKQEKEILETKKGNKRDETKKENETVDTKKRKERVEPKKRKENVPNIANKKFKEDTKKIGQEGNAKKVTIEIKKRDILGKTKGEKERTNVARKDRADYLELKNEGSTTLDKKVSIQIKDKSEEGKLRAEKTEDRIEKTPINEKGILKKVSKYEYKDQGGAITKLLNLENMGKKEEKNEIKTTGESKNEVVLEKDGTLKEKVKLKEEGIQTEDGRIEEKDKTGEVREATDKLYEQYKEEKKQYGAKKKATDKLYEQFQEKKQYGAKKKQDSSMLKTKATYYKGDITQEVKLLNQIIKKHEKVKIESLKYKNRREKEFGTHKKKAAEKTSALLRKDKSSSYIDVKGKRQLHKHKETQVDGVSTKSESKKETEVKLKDLKAMYADDNLIIKLIKKYQSKTRTREQAWEPIIGQKIHKIHRASSYSTDEYSSDVSDKSVKTESEFIFGNTIITKQELSTTAPELQLQPILFQSLLTEDGDGPFNEQAATTEGANLLNEDGDGDMLKVTEATDSEKKGVFKYALSDPTFIENGWTRLPVEKIIRKMNIYRMRPAQPEFDWFVRNKGKDPIQYDSGEKLAEVTENGRGQWYYKNGRIALDYYDSEGVNAQQRFVIYSSGDPDNRGRSYPITVLGMFDYKGNGVVFDHTGKIRLKYNQTEGVILDRGIGPVCHWLWHSLNEPPELQQVMIDTRLPFTDPTIYSFGNSNDKQPKLEEDDTMLAIEFDNYMKSKNVKPTQKFNPYQINMKALRINDQFSLRVIDQRTVYLIFRDGANTMRLNLGMVLDHTEIVDTRSAEIGEVTLDIEDKPAATSSLADLQKSLLHAQKTHQTRTERELKKRPIFPGVRADHLTAATSKPTRAPLLTTSEIANYSKCGKPISNNLYSNTRLI